MFRFRFMKFHDVAFPVFLGHDDELIGVWLIAPTRYRWLPTLVSGPLNSGVADIFVSCLRVRDSAGVRGWEGEGVEGAGVVGWENISRRGRGEEGLGGRPGGPG
jgi:hypothetical protein